MNRALTVLATVAVAIALTGCGTATTPTTPSSTAAARAVESTTSVPDVTGMPGDQARDQLTAAGFTVELTAADGSSVWKASNWSVDSQAPAAGAELEAGATVMLTVSKPAAVEVPAAAVLATSTGLTGTYAQAACDWYGEQQFPYGFKGHWILGKLAEEIQNDQWFFKIEATVTNEYKAKRDYNVECFVTGTNDAPVVTTFNAY
jgi:PASTA domain